MTGSKRTKRPVAYLVFTAVLGVIVATLGPAGRAVAVTDTITAVSSSPNSELANLSVKIDSTTSMSALVVHLLNSQNTDVLDPAVTEGPETTTDTGFESTWTLSTPTDLANVSALPLGTYTVTVDATDAGGPQPGIAAGTLKLVDQLTFTIGADHTALDYGQQTATVSGTVTSLAPDGTSGPYTSQSIKFEGPAAGAVTTISTDGSGNYSKVITPLDGDSAQVAASASTATGQSTVVNFTVHRDQEQITASISHTTITYGTQVTAKGTVKYVPVGSSTLGAVANRKVSIYDTQSGSKLVKSANTDSNGNFSVVLPNLNGDTTWRFTVGTASDPYLTQATTTVGMAVNLPVAVTNFKMSLNQFWQLTYSGCVTLTKSVPGNPGIRLGQLQIQHATSPNGPWSKMNIGFTRGGPCGIQGWSFHASNVLTPYNAAYYRAYFTGAKSDGGVHPGYNAAASKAVLAWKYADRITNFSVTPHTVAMNGNITVKGTLQYFFNAKWHAYAGQTIYIIFRQLNSSKWFLMTTVKTNSAGNFSTSFADVVGSATWAAQFNGNSTHLAYGMPGIYIRVT
jgi:hypothetical protein